MLGFPVGLGIVAFAVFRWMVFRWNRACRLYWTAIREAPNALGDEKAVARIRRMVQRADQDRAVAERMRTAFDLPPFPVSSGGSAEEQDLEALVRAMGARLRRWGDS